MARVWLTKKLADYIDGVSLVGRKVGDVLDLPADEARLLLAEEWANADRRVASVPTTHRRRAADHLRPRSRERTAARAKDSRS